MLNDFFKNVQVLSEQSRFPHLNYKHIFDEGDMDLNKSVCKLIVYELQFIAPGVCSPPVWRSGGDAPLLFV